jgi:hypothetical protein
MNLKIKIMLILTASVFSINSIMAAVNDIVVGDTAEKVFIVLGRPEGQIKSGTFLMLSYPRGKIELHDKIVTKVDLISGDELNKKLIKEKEQKRRRAENIKRYKEQHYAKGIRLHKEKLSDPEFANLPTTEQLYYWQEFKKIYPGVDVSDACAALLEIRERELREEEVDNRLAAMEQRVADAEARAASAEQEARDSNYSSYYPEYYYPYRPTYIFGGNQCKRPRTGHRVIQSPPLSIYENHTHSVHPESLYGNSTIRAIRSSKSQSIRSFRH